MDLTSLFAQIWGPVLVLIGIGILVGPSHYLTVYRDLKKEPFAAFVFGTFAIALGLAHIGMHNHWSVAEEIIVSLLGWGLFLKGALFIIAPDVVGRVGTIVSSRRAISVIAMALIIVGTYLTWTAYLA